MGNIIVNQPGTQTFNLPKKLMANDKLIFNVTNVDRATRYTGHIIDYTFPSDCTVKFECYGAKGGDGGLGTKTTGFDYNIGGKGAYVYGTFSFLKGERILILVGQQGTTYYEERAVLYPDWVQSSVTDSTGGSGGGGTFICKVVEEGGDLIIGGPFAGLRVIPLIIAAGGNGGGDYAYSTSVTRSAYGGMSSTGTTFSSTTGQTGGGYSYEGTYSNKTYIGKSFLNGGDGASYTYTRSSGCSRAGFGGGGSNPDDGYGGGGGGYLPGNVTTAARSYNIGEDAGGADAVNLGNGFVEMTVIKAKNFEAAQWVYYGDIKVEWDRSIDNEYFLGYKLERSINSAEYELIATLGPDQLTYIDNIIDLTVESVQYRVCGYDTYSQSDYTTSVQIGLIERSTFNARVNIGNNIWVEAVDVFVYNGTEWITVSDTVTL